MLVPCPPLPWPGRALWSTLGGWSCASGLTAAESSLLELLAHSRCLMRQLLGSQLRAQAPSALWLRPSWGAGGLCTQHPASKESKAGPRVSFCHSPPYPLLPIESHSSPSLTCPVGLETQVQAGQLAPPAVRCLHRAGADRQQSCLPPTAGGRNAARAPGGCALVPHVSPAWGLCHTFGGVNSDLLTE